MDPGSFVVIALRLGVPVLILRYQVGGFLACIIIDGLHAPLVHLLNAHVFAFSGPVVDYQLSDKWLDMYFLAFAARASQKWNDQLNGRAVLWLWVVRAVGVMAYSVTGLRWFLFVFPNLLVAYFGVLVVARRWFPHAVPRTPKQLCILLSLLLVPKLILEYWLHVQMLGLGEALSRYTPLRIPAPTLWQWVLPGP